MVDFYGVHPNVPIDPAKVKVPVQLHFGERDTNVPAEKARELVDRLTDSAAEALSTPDRSNQQCKQVTTCICGGMV